MEGSAFWEPVGLDARTTLCSGYPTKGPERREARLLAKSTMSRRAPSTTSHGPQSRSLPDVYGCEKRPEQRSRCDYWHLSSLHDESPVDIVVRRLGQWWSAALCLVWLGQKCMYLVTPRVDEHWTRLGSTGASGLIPCRVGVEWRGSPSGSSTHA